VPQGYGLRSSLPKADDDDQIMAGESDAAFHPRIVTEEIPSRQVVMSASVEKVIATDSAASTDRRSTPHPSR
jgi:hypothetical protein